MSIEIYTFSKELVLPNRTNQKNWTKSTITKLVVILFCLVWFDRNIKTIAKSKFLLHCYSFIYLFIIELNFRFFIFWFLQLCFTKVASVFFQNNVVQSWFPTTTTNLMIERWHTLSLIISKIRVSKFTPWKFIFRWLASPAYKNDVWHSPSSLTILDKRKWRMLLTLIFKWEKGINTCLGRRGISWTNSQVTHSLWGIFQFFIIVDSKNEGSIYIG